MAKTIRAGTIASLLRNVLDPYGERQIEWEAPASDYIIGAGGEMTAFVNVLNGSQQFSGYGLSLETYDLADVDLLRDIVAAIIKWFQDNGWKVVI
jgi:hypothetical protein